MKTVHIKNLELFHPGYKDRELIWCKVYFTMINANPEFELLCEIDKWRFVAFIMLELQTKKPIPLDPVYLARKGFDLKKRDISLTLNMLHNSIEITNVCNAGVTQSRVDKDKIREEGDKIKGNITNNIPPALGEIKSFFSELKAPNIEADKFFDYFSSNGWKIGGKAPMKDWQAAARNWIRRAGPAPATPKKVFKSEPVPVREEVSAEGLQKIRALVQSVTAKCKGVE